MEKWVKIKGFDCYEVSDCGRVKSLKFNKERILKPNKRRHGYLAVELNGRSFSIHRLVLESFVPNTENKTDVNHKNGVKFDNRLENLEWCTHSENAKHSFKIGNQNNSGSNHPQAILDEDKVKEIRNELANGFRGIGMKLAKKYGVSFYTISKIKKGKIWPNVK